MTVLLSTKLRQPAPPPRRVQRPHLIQRLDGGLAAGRQITLVSAPAGFGKTTCVSEWVDGLDGWPVAWLSLDAADDDPGRFFSYLLAALQTVDGSLGREIEGVLRAGQLPPSEALSATLSNDILRSRGPGAPFLLVLDNLQVVQDRTILDVLEQLVANLPPPLYLVLVTREDPPLPLARLRANNHVTEIRVGELRFDERDAARFLNEVMGLSLSPADVAALEAKTEGWIAGLQLAGLSIRDRADPSAFIDALSGSHRFILGYLTEQVLSQQPRETQRFLLQTSILDALRGDLCDAVTQRSDSRALLEGLCSANLFLAPLDDERQWYRYHPLFADLLRDLQGSLHAKESPDLHQRASRWYARAGMASEAIEHALAAADYALAVDLLERHAPALVMQGYVKTVSGWVQAIPGEWGSQSPRTNLAFAWMHLLGGTYAGASPYLARLEATFAGAEVRDLSAAEWSSLRAEWLVIQSLLLSKDGVVAERLALADQALQAAPQEDHRVRSLAHWGLAVVHHLAGEAALAAEAYRKAMEHGRLGGNTVAELMSVSGLASLALERGQLHLAFEIVSQAAGRIERSGVLHPISAVVYGILGQVHCEWYELERARKHTLRAIQLSALGGYSTGAVYYRMVLARVDHLEGNLEAAARHVQDAVDRVQAAAPADLRQQVATQQVRVYLAQDRLAAAEMVLQGHGFSFHGGFSYPDLALEQRDTHAAGLLYNSGLRVLLYRAQARREPASLETGIGLADRLIARATQGPLEHILVAVEALLLRAQMHGALGSREASLGDCAAALELAEPEAMVSAFVEHGPSLAGPLASLVEQGRIGDGQRDHVERILAALPGIQARGKAAKTGSVALVEPLTARELDVLRLMAEGLKYREIAEDLYVSLNTVRSHVKAIYGKLGVDNRTRAIERARQLQML